MKINKVKLYNFSSYEGNNEFDFEITDGNKNIILIGGKMVRVRHRFLQPLKLHYMVLWHMDMLV